MSPVATQNILLFNLIVTSYYNPVLTLCPYPSHNLMDMASLDTCGFPLCLDMSDQYYTHLEQFCIHPHLHKKGG
jgi:hypothetical protein